jgi:hypothetical protein
VLGGQAEDTEAIQKREDVRRNDLKDEHGRKSNPKQAYPFVVRSVVKVQS